MSENRTPGGAAGEDAASRPMAFTWQAYRELLELFREHGYAFRNYRDWEMTDTRCVILRHDIDNSPEAALPMAELEAAFGVSSTWFVLMTSDLYNPMSPRCRRAFRKLLDLGHEIGLHFDEAAYPAMPSAGGTGRKSQNLDGGGVLLSDLAG